MPASATLTERAPLAEDRAAVRALDATKIYGEGDTAVRALDGVDRRHPRRPLDRDHGSVGLGQVDA